MARIHIVLAVSLLSYVAIGCVSSEKYIAAKMDADQSASRLSAIEREKSEAMAARDAYKQQLDNVMLGGGQKEALIVNQSTQISDLQNQLAELNKRYADAAGRVGTTVMLPQDLNDQIKSFAAANPDLVEYDANRGVVKFKSDVTFAPGSAILTPTAMSAIDRFAGIVNSASAAGYELVVVGHTDNVHVSHQATLAAGHKDNWYLSAHRAISVSAEMQKLGVSATRLEVAGCADQRPIAPNTTDGGRAQNRRVEVLITPATARGSVADAPIQNLARPASARTLAKPVARLDKDYNKDAAVDNTKSAFNK